MGQAKDLVVLGLPPEVAKRTGWTVLAVTTTSTAQNNGGVLKGPGNLIINATPHASNGALTLPNNADIGDQVFVTNVTASGGNAIKVFPDTGSTIMAVGPNTGLAIASAISCLFLKVGATVWKALLGAAATPA